MTSRLDSPSTLCEAFQSTAAAYPDHVALRTPDDSVHYTWREYSEKVRALAAGLERDGGANVGVADDGFGRDRVDVQQRIPDDEDPVRHAHSGRRDA